MQRTHANDARGRSRVLLEKTERIIEQLSETLADFIAEGESALARLKWHRSQVNELERKCEEMKVHVEATQSAKQKMETVAEDLRHSLSPMRTVPTEILTRIFEIAVSDEVGVCRSLLSVGRSRTPRAVTLALSQVCRRWREIASEMPSLWAFLYFGRATTVLPEGQEKSINLFRHYAGFASPNQQSVVIPECDITKLVIFCTTIGILKVPYNSLEIVMLEDPPGGWDIDVLSSREVTIYRSGDVETLKFIVPLLQVANTVTLYGTPPGWDSPPWAMLETLILRDFCNARVESSIYGFTRDDFIELLNATPSLKKLVLDFHVDEAHMGWDDHLSMSSSSIEHLSIHVHHFTGSKGLFGVQLALPALETLEILSFLCVSPIPDDDEFICKYLTPKRVVLCQMKETDVTLVGQLLRRLPNATSLEITGRHCNNLLRIAHTDYHSISPPSMPLPIPQVTKLCITDTDIQGEALIRFLEIKVQHRRAGTLGVVCLEDIRMYTTPGVTPAEWARVQTMLEAGRKANGN